MARRNVHSLASLALALGGFAACTFGADDFTIVSADGSGANDSGGAPDGQGGNEDSGGSDVGPSGGTNSVAGAGVGGDEPALGGAGGAPNGPRFLCSPLAQTLDVLTTVDLEGRTIQGEPFVVAVQDTVIIGVATEPTGGTTPQSRLFVRPVTDSDGGSLEQIGTYDINGNRLQIAAVAPEGPSFTILGVADSGIFDLTYTTADGGRTLQDTNIHDLPMHEVCDTTSGGVDGHVRNLAGFYDTDEGDWTYAATCASVPPGGGEEQLSLWRKLADAPSAEGISQVGQAEIDSIVRQYVKIGDTHFMLVGEEVGPSLNVRSGTTRDHLKTLSSIGLSDDPMVFTSLMIRPIDATLFVHGTAFTTDGTQSPPLVPAQVYDGSVKDEDLHQLFINTDGSNVPPSPLQQTATFTKASELIGMDDAMQLGANNVLLAGASLAPRNSVNVAVVTRDGVVLAPPTQIYETESLATTIDDHSVKVAPLGIGFLAVWIEDGAVKARSVSCLQD